MAGARTIALGAAVGFLASLSFTGGLTLSACLLLTRFQGYGATLPWRLAYSAGLLVALLLVYAIALAIGRGRVGPDSCGWKRGLFLALLSFLLALLIPLYMVVPL